MPKLHLYNPSGELVNDVDVSDVIFGVKPDAAFVHEVVIGLQANARRSIASTKTRGEVRGGGKKPWKQKGTGRARQGSIRAPQWVGGGITFGPLSERNFHQKINKKAKQKALFMALSDKMQDQQVLAVEGLATEPAKTKILASVIKKLPIGKTVLFITAGSHPKFMQMARNIPFVTCVTSSSVNLEDVISHRSIVFLKGAIPAFEKLYV